MNRYNFEIGHDGAIQNFIGDIAQTARESNGFVVEVGVGIGTGSTVAIHEGLKDHLAAIHISVDCVDHMQWKPPVPWWHLVIGDSRHLSTVAVVRQLTEVVAPGLIYIDTDHTYDHMASELPVWATLADDHTVWLFHDVQIWGIYNPMTDAIKEFAAANGWVYDHWRPETHGLGRMRRP